MRTSEVFSNIKAKDLLLQIAAKRNIDVDEHSKNLGKAIADDAFNTGIKKFVELLKAETVDDFGVDTKNADGQKLHRSVVKKRVIQKVQDDTPQKFLEGLDNKVLAKVFDDLGEDKPSNSKKYVEEIIKLIDLFGLENALSTLTLAELQALCKAHKLKVSSGTSANAHIEALVTGEDQKKETKSKAPKEEPSKKKPADIKKGIKKIDLQHHFYREELTTYCKDHKLPYTGTKSQLIKIILDHLDGKDVATKKRKAPSGGKKEKPAKKAKTTKSEKSEKSEKEDKSEKSEKDDDEKTEKSEKSEKSEKEKPEKETGKKGKKN